MGVVSLDERHKVPPAQQFVVNAVEVLPICPANRGTRSTGGIIWGAAFVDMEFLWKSQEYIPGARSAPAKKLGGGLTGGGLGK